MDPASDGFCLCRIRINEHQPEWVRQRRRSNLTQRIAHAFWESEGRPDGREAEHWRMATLAVQQVQATIEPTLRGIEECNSGQWVSGLVSAVRHKLS